MEDAKEVCPTTTQKLLKDGAILVDVRERDEIDALAFDVPSLIIMPMSELESRFAELPKDVPLILACRKGVRSLKATYFNVSWLYECHKHEIWDRAMGCTRVPCQRRSWGFGKRSRYRMLWWIKAELM